MKHGNIWTICHIKSKNKKQTATMPTNVAGMSALAGGVSGVPATAVPGGLQSASMASIELGKKRMRDSNDDLLMVPRLMHEVHFPFLVAGPYENGPLRGFSSQVVTEGHFLPSTFRSGCCFCKETNIYACM